MKALFLLAVLANIVFFMWEFKHGAFETSVKQSSSPGNEPMVLVSELPNRAEKIDFFSLFPPGLDPLADNWLTEPVTLKQFTGDLLLSDEPEQQADVIGTVHD